MRVRARQNKRREEEGGVRGSVREAVRFFFPLLSLAWAWRMRRALLERGKDWFDKRRDEEGNGPWWIVLYCPLLRATLLVGHEGGGDKFRVGPCK
jgi:hypothetical protein